MKIISNVSDMQRWADDARRRGQRIGFVPTMGYLHAGHLSLVEIARRHADLVVASIFVNPMQFGPTEDLSKYPRDLERDSELLRDAGTDVLFFPSEAEMYPRGFQTSVTVENVTRGLCGAARPVHFRGVTTVVTKLFNVVKPHVAVFGKKDYQQWITIRRLVTDLNLDIEIIGGDIVREADGLAMSSRNAYLSAAQRSAALCLSRALAVAEAAIQRGESQADSVREAAQRVIAGEPAAQLDYIEIVTSDTLEPVTEIAGEVLIALAVFIGKTRLIDNRVVTLRREQRPHPGTHRRDQERDLKSQI